MKIKKKKVFNIFEIKNVLNSYKAQVTKLFYTLYAMTAFIKRSFITKVINNFSINDRRMSAIQRLEINKKLKEI